jgi:photosystem II stability/assembly factor-like uncharacterized protein
MGGLVSNDAGLPWTQRTPPPGMFDLTIDPENRDHVVASTERGLYSSQNAGRTWRPLRDDVAGLLAWPVSDELCLVDGEGRVLRSADGGRQWKVAGSIGAPPAAFISEARGLYVGVVDWTVKRSTDDGRNWTARASP